jgi:hypothetical protein
MKKTIVNTLSIITSSLLLSACGGSSGDTTSSTSITSSFSGIAVDGYISGATTCLDLNINSSCDASEPTTVTDDTGKFTFSNLTVNTNTLYPVIVSGGIDTATGKNFEGEMKNIISSNDINDGIQLNVSPLTDLVATSFLQSSTKDESALTSSKSSIANALGIETTTIDADTMKDTKAFAKAQEVQQIKELIKTTTSKTVGSELTTVQQANITSALVNQLTTNNSLDVAKVLTDVEATLAITIPVNEKTFISEQTSEIQTQLTSISNDTTIDITKLDEIQNALETKLNEAHEIISNASSSDILTKVDIPDTTTLITTGETLATNTAPYFMDGTNKITSKTISIDENNIAYISFSNNSTNSFFGADGIPISIDNIVNILAKDDNSDTLTYTLGGVDNAYFTIDSNGKLTSQLFDYENALDTNKDNTYTLQVIANDGKVKAYLDVFVKVNNLDDNTPTLSDISNVILDKNSATHSITLNGNDLDGTTVSYTVSSTQQDILYSLVLEESILKITPITNKYGTDTISVTASSNGKSVTKQFTLTIQDTGALVIPTNTELPRPPMMPNL